MNVPLWVWGLTLVGVVAVLAVDLFVIGRRPHEPSAKEAALWVAFYFGLAGLFGAGVFWFAPDRYGAEFFAGWITEYSMSVDNLFVFMLIMSSFAVPRRYQQKVLMVGIITALILRAVFIGIGAGLVEEFVWIFFIFGGFLIFTAIQLLRSGDEEEEFKENAVIRFVRRVVPVAPGYNGGKLTAHMDGKKVLSPMLIVMIAIGTTDLLFAFDSIPATFGLTQQAYLVLTVNVFALMGLRQLFFLLGGLLERLVYLNYGLAFILGFIGVKLVLHALAHNDVPFLNGGKPIDGVPEINTWVSLAVIVGILAIATIASLASPPRKPRDTAEYRAAVEEGAAEVESSWDDEESEANEAEAATEPGRDAPARSLLVVEDAAGAHQGLGALGGELLVHHLAVVAGSVDHHGLTVLAGLGGDSHVVDRLAVAREEVQVAGLGVVRFDRGGRRRLVVGVARHPDAQLAVHQVHKGRTVDAVGAQAAPHVRHVQQLRGDGQRVDPPGRGGLGLVGCAGDVVQPDPARRARPGQRHPRPAPVGLLVDDGQPGSQPDAGDQHLAVGFVPDGRGGRRHDVRQGLGGLGGGGLELLHRQPAGIAALVQAGGLVGDDDVCPTVLDVAHQHLVAQEHLGEGAVHQPVDPLLAGHAGHPVAHRGRLAQREPVGVLGGLGGGPQGRRRHGDKRLFSLFNRHVCPPRWGV